MKYLIFLSLIFAGCGVKIKSDPIRVDPIKVEHRIILDTTELYKAYQQSCTDELPVDATQEEINDCADTKLNDFIEKFTNLG